MTIAEHRAARRRIAPHARSWKLAACAVALAALACLRPVEAHHSSAMFDSSIPIWVKGTVVRSESVNPHAWIVLEETTEEGRIRRWTVEGPNQGRLNRMGVGHGFLKAGDIIEVCGFALQGYGATAGSSPDPYRVSEKFVHGHMFVMPDGQKRLWGPYGKLNNCVRPNDSAQSWVDFLNADPLAWEAGCVRAPGRTPSVVVSNAFLDEVRGALAEPCGVARP